ncbi:MAG: 30S ribosomal protein S18 [bacterium]|nr:30S ribosomal protein S18 [bacterium]MBU1917826.1 30S ribosomal protein S18 [bacterium]
MKRKSTERKFNAKKNVLRKKFCRFCTDSENYIDFRRAKMLAEFLTERGKIVPRRVSGNCQFHQTRVVESIKRARHLALLPYTSQHVVRD